MWPNTLLSARPDDRDMGRMNELSELAQRGKLTTEDQGEPVSYINVGNFITTLQSKARRALNRGAR